MSHVQENLLRFYSKLNKLREEEKYTDVTLQCESKNFKCHRLVLTVASPYFETMFESSFKESTMKSISLKEVSAATFEEVLQFMYTGNVDVNAANVYNLLQASNYYNLPGIEDLCLKFIANANTRLRTIRNVFPMFSYVCNTGKNDFVSILSKLVAEHFGVLCKLREFFEISFDSLHIILEHYLSLPSRNEEFLLTTIIRWTCHKREERSQFLDKFLGMIQLESISPAYYRLMTKMFIAERDPNIDVFPTPADCNTISEYEDDSISKITNYALHVYVKYEEQKVKIFSLNDANECTDSGEILLTYPDTNIRCTVSDDSYLYCLDYIRRVPDKQDLGKEIFCAYTSVDRLVTSTLTPPSLLFYCVSLCYLQNNIYAYNERVLYNDVIRTNSKSCEMMKKSIVVFLFIIAAQIIGFLFPK